MYSELVRMHKEEELDFSEIKTFNLDEYYNISSENDQSYYYFMHDNLFDHVNLDSENIGLINGMTENVEEECVNYEKRIKAAGGIDIQVLGIGRNGHIGFNEPDSKFEPLTHLVHLDEDTIKANARFFETEAEVPVTAISMGMKTIMSAKKILLVANGESKAKAIKDALEGDVNPQMPASILQLHPDVTVIVDKEAGKLLSK
jgi:glucosamine-6-phosphate deaminase